jgi:hypothetical protein
MSCAPTIVVKVIFLVLTSSKSFETSSPAHRRRLIARRVRLFAELQRSAPCHPILDLWFDHEQGLIKFVQHVIFQSAEISKLPSILPRDGGYLWKIVPTRPSRYGDWMATRELWASDTWLCDLIIESPSGTRAGTPYLHMRYYKWFPVTNVFLNWIMWALFHGAWFQVLSERRVEVINHSAQSPMMDSQSDDINKTSSRILLSKHQKPLS